MKALAGPGLFAALLVGVYGCGQAPAPAPTPVATQTAPSAASADDTPFPTPEFGRQSGLALISDTNGNSVKVGDDEEAFKRAFPREATIARSLRDNEIPVGADPANWTVNGWALDNASRGVGALFYNGKVALAMSQFDNVEENDVSSQVSKYQIPLGPGTTIDGKHVRYWFWQRGTSLLMICAFKNRQNELNLTTAIGDAQVMDRLHMSFSTAEDDMRSVERLYGTVGASREVAGSTK